MQTSINVIPLVSLIINNYNYDRFLAHAIDSALSQTYKNVEVIVIDDGSQDSSQAIIASYGEKIVAIAKENGGQASCYNIGFAASHGDIICFLDADDVFLPHKIAEIVAAFQRSDNIGWCFHSLTLIDQDNHSLPGTTTVNYVTQACDFRALLTAGKMPPNLPPSSCLCFRRSLLAQILPMPTSKALRAGDNYVKFVAVGLSQGFMLADSLTLQRIHDANMVTMQPQKAHLTAREYAYTGSWLRREFPEFRKFANKLLSLAICITWRLVDSDRENTQTIQDYLSCSTALEKLKIYLLAIYYTRKTLIVKLLRAISQFLVASSLYQPSRKLETSNRKPL
ncbi:glycosyltransferase family 2 protein [Stenomitos frigidus]|uniref:glycosyltransferase family 2 protein n=1 Tax=Stenomitos frigidus TaxID=1886765 RepID=UPI001FE8B3FF|nr:glycosyltransferase family A protein [Stenomitos frigidus]